MKYRKKPVVIEAVRWNGNNFDEIKALVGEKSSYNIVNDKSLLIFTLEGDLKATKGDYIIKGVKGEFYPCKPDIFRATYEKLGGE